MEENSRKDRQDFVKDVSGIAAAEIAAPAALPPEAVMPEIAAPATLAPEAVMPEITAPENTRAYSPP